ncbi:MAG: phosphate ABC transporter permease subunit PstC [Neisseriaceae bacterium]|nr:phosphate ABC transporter permease subunit PstC [Neisseriaceae bacterium]
MKEFQQSSRRKNRGDRALAVLVYGSAWLTLFILLSVLLMLVWRAWPSIAANGWSFLTSDIWNPTENQYGALVPIYGTLVTSTIALIIAVPVSFGIALFLTELSPIWLRRPLGTAIELLAAIPSIVYGMWGLLFFVPLFAQYVQAPLMSFSGEIPILNEIFSGAPFGLGLLTAGVVLSIMIIPFIASVMRDVFEIVPNLLKESAYGLGCTRWEVIWQVVLPYTKRGVIGGIMLGLGRALGETMAVTFVIGNSNVLSGFSLFAMGNSITSLLSNEFNEASSPLHTAALLELGLILFILTFFVLSLSKLLLGRLDKQSGAST